jgi:hypothetical protein
MLQQTVFNTKAGETITICGTTDGSAEYVIASLFMNGGTTGGEINLSINDYSMIVTIGADDHIAIAWPITVPAGGELKATATSDDMQISVSAYARAVKE